MHYVLIMRRSPLKHPLAILRTTIGLTQKEMGDLVGRAARTIQSVELGNLPLSEDLAMSIAQATGIDAGWLLENNPEVAPRKGLTAQNMASSTGNYTRSDYEFHRAFIESPTASREQMETIVDQLEKTADKGKKLVTMTLPVMKAAVLAQKKRMLQAFDQQTLDALKTLLDKTAASDAGDLVRWKIRRMLKSLANEHSVKLSLPASSDTAGLHIHIVDKPEEKPTGRRKNKAQP